MNIDNIVPLLVGHVGKSLVTEDTGVVDQDIDSAKVVDGGLDDSITILNISLVANGLASELLDFLNGSIRIDKIVDNHGRTPFGKGQAVCAAETVDSLVDVQ